MPLGYTLLGWHGLANAAALVLLALLLLYLAELAAGRLDPAAAAGAGLLIMGMAAMHRLTFGIAMITAGLAVVVGLLAARRAPRAASRHRDRRRGDGPDRWRRRIRPDRAQPHASAARRLRAYLASKVDLDLLVRDLTIPLAVVGLGAVVAAPFLVRDRRTVLAALSASPPWSSALAYSWLVDVPLATRAWRTTCRSRSCR